MALRIWTATALALCLIQSAASYREFSEPYSERDAFLSLLESSLLANSLNPLNGLADDRSLPVPVRGYDVERQYGPDLEMNSNYNNWGDEDSLSSGILNDEDSYFDRVTKGDEAEQQLLDEEFGAADPLTNPMTRDQEYLQHSTLWGNKYMQGGAGEGSQILKPDGSQKNSQEMKTDAVLPAYCDPPNPCPVGYTAEDGCLEDFENTAAFSREYQEAQDCLCDAEHMFGCGEPRGSGSDGPNGDGTDDDDDAAQADAIDALLRDYKISGQHKNLVAKKFHTKKSEEAVRRYETELRERAKAAAAKYSKRTSGNPNPFLDGEKLPVAAKKGMKLA